MADEELPERLDEIIDWFADLAPKFVVGALLLFAIIFFFMVVQGPISKQRKSRTSDAGAPLDPERGEDPKASDPGPTHSELDGPGGGAGRE